MHTSSSICLPEEGHQCFVSLRKVERTVSEGRELLKVGKVFNLHRRYTEQRQIEPFPVLAIAEKKVFASITGFDNSCRV